MKLITGNTYPVKDQIKALGGKWNGQRKGWEVPDEVADQARALLDGAPGRRSSYPRNRSSYGSYYTRFQGGGEAFQNKRGRCEDAPCCGCCS
jgi:hypothetical protein